MRAIMTTVCEVHFMIQQMNSKLTGYDNDIMVSAIAECLHMNDEELRLHLDTLSHLYYIHFIGRKHGEIKLTFNGKYTVVPG